MLYIYLTQLLIQIHVRHEAPTTHTAQTKCPGWASLRSVGPTESRKLDLVMANAAYLFAMCTTSYPITGAHQFYADANANATSPANYHKAHNERFRSDDECI